MLVSLSKFQLFCYCVVSSEFLILAFLLVLPSIELRLSKIYRLSASIDGLVNGTVDTALNYTWRLNLNYEFHKKKVVLELIFNSTEWNYPQLNFQLYIQQEWDRGGRGGDCHQLDQKWHGNQHKIFSFFLLFLVWI